MVDCDFHLPSCCVGCCTNVGYKQHQRLQSRTASRRDREGGDERPNMTMATGFDLQLAISGHVIPLARAHYNPI